MGYFVTGSILLIQKMDFGIMKVLGLAIIVKRGDESCRIFKDDIYYIEVDNHHIILHLHEETIRFKAKMKEFEMQFKEPQFCKCHRSYIVNLKYVGRISREGVEVDGKREWWYVNFANEKNNYVSIMIIDGEVAHIDFDAATGELILAEEEIEYSNGDVEWKSFN